MIKLGYKLMSEEHGPEMLVRNAQRAEGAGFDFAAISDHFFPWLDEQGHSPFAWSVLGAAAQATEKLGLMTSVTCPSIRYHPAIVAQAAATMALLTGDRFVLGLGSGERLNEHVTGEGWPGIVERHERFAEAIDIIQGLLAGELENYRGTHLTLDNARLFDRPKKKPQVVVAAGGADAARLAGRKGDGLMVTEPDAGVINTFKQEGGSGPVYAEVSLFGWSVNAELPDTKGFAAASEHVTAEMLAKEITCGPSTESHLQAVRRHIEAGCDHIILTQIGPRQDEFLTFFKKELAPALRELASS
jgi:G6PDH family F420-dependent oxidoreductase